MKKIDSWKVIDHMTNDKGLQAYVYSINGYLLISREASYMPGGVAFEVRPESYPRGYLPEVYIDTEGWFDGPQRIRIMTTSYGSLKPEEIDMVIDGFRRAQDLGQKVIEAFPECF